MTLSYTETNATAKKRLYHQLKSMLGHLGMHSDHMFTRHAYMKNDIPVAGCAHQAGTCRFGTDPASSVVDVNCKAHELDNLYVVDTSIFPSIGAVNPALTAMANALRVGDHLLDRMGAARSSGRPLVTAEADGGRRRVVVIGGGFGGLTVARELRRANADVTLVDRTNHHLFQPLLYQVAAGGLSEGDCASAIRGHLRRQANASVLMAEVTDLDVERRRVILDRAEPLDYDSLVVACGAETSYFGHDEWAEASFGLKTLRDAVALRERIVSAFEEAERASDPTLRDELLTFVVVGGGPTGVEIAGQLAILARKT